jgi:hypothetical protein
MIIITVTNRENPCKLAILPVGKSDRGIKCKQPAGAGPAGCLWGGVRVYLSRKRTTK